RTRDSRPKVFGAELWCGLATGTREYWAHPHMIFCPQTWCCRKTQPVLRPARWAANENYCAAGCGHIRGRPRCERRARPDRDAQSRTVSPGHVEKGRQATDCYETRVVKRFRAMFRVPEHRFFSFG